MSVSEPSKFDMCVCGWTRVQHCAKEPHPCSHTVCRCKGFTLAKGSNYDLTVTGAVRNNRDLENASYHTHGGYH